MNMRDNQEHPRQKRYRKQLTESETEPIPIPSLERLVMKLMVIIKWFLASSIVDMLASCLLYRREEDWRT